MKKLLVFILAFAVISGCSKKEEKKTEADKTKTEIKDSAKNNTSGKKLTQITNNTVKGRDTSFTSVFSPDKKEQTVTVSVRGLEASSDKGNIVYTIGADGNKWTDTTFSDPEVYDIKLIDLKVSDGFKGLLFGFYTGSGDDYRYRIYKFTDKPQLIAKDLYYSTFETDGKGGAKAKYYTGFTNITETFQLSAFGNKFEVVEVEYYPIDIKVTVTNPFNLFSEKNNNSTLVTRTNKGEKIKLTGFDNKSIEIKKKEIRIIKGEEVKEDKERGYNWFKIQTSNNKTGWMLVETCNFKEFFEGVNCAD